MSENSKKKKEKSNNFLFYLVKFELYNRVKALKIEKETLRLNITPPQKQQLPFNCVNLSSAKKKSSDKGTLSVSWYRLIYSLITQSPPIFFRQWTLPGPLQRADSRSQRRYRGGDICEKDPPDNRMISKESEALLFITVPREQEAKLEVSPSSDSRVGGWWRVGGKPDAPCSIGAPIWSGLSSNRGSSIILSVLVRIECEIAVRWVKWFSNRGSIKTTKRE